jgi:serine/threonine protein phosphatase 1
MSTYVVSDIHGCYKEFIAGLELINFSAQDHLYILGDVIDRGSGSAELAQWLVEHEGEYTLLRGNHEEMMLETYREEDNWFHLHLGDDWAHNGGIVTTGQLELLDEDIFKEYIRICKESAYYKQINVNGADYLLVHAGLYPGLPVEHQLPFDMVWVRKEWLLSSKRPEKFTVIFGHTPTPTIARIKEYIPELADQEAGKIMKWRDRIAIDCGCVRGYNLGFLRLDDMQEFYIKKFEEEKDEE